MVKNLPDKVGDIRDAGMIPRWGRSLGVANGNLLQYSQLENSMGRKNLVDYSLWGLKESTRLWLSTFNIQKLDFWLFLKYPKIYQDQACTLPMAEIGWQSWVTTHLGEARGIRSPKGPTIFWSSRTIPICSLAIPANSCSLLSSRPRRWLNKGSALVWWAWFKPWLCSGVCVGPNSFYFSSFWVNVCSF